MEGLPVLGPIEHSVLELTLDGRHSAMTIHKEPFTHSVLDVALDGRLMEGIPVLEPLEHLVLVGALDSGPMEGMSHFEPLELSVLNAARGNWSGKAASVCEPLEHSVRMMTLDDSHLEKMSDDEPLEHLVWSDALSAQHSGISTDVLLFSDIHLSLVHHYRVHKRGLPHIVFCRNYLSQLRALLPSPVALPPARVVSPESSGSGSLHPVTSY